MTHGVQGIKGQQNIDQLIQDAIKALQNGDYATAAQDFQQAAQAAGLNTPLGQELSKEAQALQQQQGTGQTSGGDQSGQSGQSGQTDSGQQSGLSQQDLLQLIKLAQDLIQKGDVTGGEALLKYATQQYSTPQTAAA
jgi:hypothetical protein